MKNECQRVDRAVRSNIVSVTTTFRESYGIRNNFIENSINYVITKVTNKMPFSGWIESKIDELKAKTQEFKDYIKRWYNYEGGKERVSAVLKILGGIFAERILCIQLL